MALVRATDGLKNVSPSSSSSSCTYLTEFADKSRGPPPQNASKLFVWSGMAMSDDDDDVIPTQSKQKPAFLRQQFLCNENVVFVHIR